MLFSKVNTDPPPSALWRGEKQTVVHFLGEAGERSNRLLWGVAPHGLAPADDFVNLGQCP